MRVKDLRKKSSKRIDTTYVSSLGIQTYGDDNLYPQVLNNIIAASSTGSGCVERLANFIEGNGLRNLDLSELVINRKGDTMDDLHTLICSDVAKFNGFAIHVNYNIFGQIVELQYVPFENCRLVEEDDNGYVSHIVLHPDWTGAKTRNGKLLRVDKRNCDYINVFNPNREVVLAQIEAVGGIEYYNGQLLWVSMAGKNTYPTGKGDAVATEMSTDEGLSNVKYRNVRNNFLPAAMIITKRGSNLENYSDRPSLQGDDFSDTLVHLQGDTNAGKLMEITLENDEEKPEVLRLNAQNYDKEFTVTDSSVIERIYSAFGQEAWYCIRIGKVGFSGDILEDAFEYYNSIVSKQQRLIERTFRAVFKHWHTPVVDDFSVEPLKYIRNATTTIQ
jgi:hypothetical protein